MRSELSEWASSVWRYVETLRHLKLIQFYNRLFRRFRKSPRVEGRLTGWRTLTGTWVPPIGKAQSLIAERHFSFLNCDGNLDSVGWRASEMDDLWRYNLHYFDDWASDGAAKRRDWHRSLELDWLAANPPDTRVSWDAYPTSLRLVNLAKSHLSGISPCTAMRNSMAVQAAHLAHQLEYHLLGNHLFANAKGLIFAGAVLAGDEAEKFWSRGLEVGQREYAEQFLADGAHFELSPMYHSILTEDLLDLINVIRASGSGDPAAKRLHDDLCGGVPDALNWLSVMSHPDGDISFFNDASFGIAPTLDALRAYARRLGLDLADQPKGSQMLSASGYARLEVGNAVVIADVAEVGPKYQPGHAHADTLSFEFSLGENRVIVNGGTSEYGRSAERSRQRSTQAHSTLELAGQNSSDTWAGFRVGRRATPKVRSWRTDREGTCLEASHHGFRFLQNCPTHFRKWELTSGDLTITDEWGAADRHEAVIRFHLHPAVEVTRLNGNLALRSGGEVIRVDCNHDILIEPATWHPQFGISVLSQSLIIRPPLKVDASCQLRLSW